MTPAEEIRRCAFLGQLDGDNELAALLVRHDVAFEAWRKAKLEDDARWATWHEAQRQILAIQCRFMQGEEAPGEADRLRTALRARDEAYKASEANPVSSQAACEAGDAVHKYIADNYLRREEFARLAGLRAR